MTNSVSRIKNRTTPVLRLLLSVALSLCVQLTQAEDEKYYFDIGANSVGEALKAFAIQADSEILFTAAIVKDKSTQGIRGEYTNREALEKILADTELNIEQSDDKVYLIHAANQQRAVPSKDFEIQGGAEKKPLAARRVEEVVVTANKREQSLQDTAMSVSALNSEAIGRRGLVSLADYLNTIPGVSHLDLGAGINTTIIRGISADPQREGENVGQTTGIYLGEVPLSGLRASGSDIKLVDMERIEILRGPQGTLYGSGSLGGTIRNIPVAPNLQTLEGSIKTSYSNTSEYGGGNTMIQGVVNLPIIENTLAVRAVAYNFQNNGYIKNIAGSDADAQAAAAMWGVEDLAVDQDDVGSDEYVGGRITALWEPTDKLTAELTYITQDLEQDGLPEVQLNKGDFLQARYQMGDPVGSSELLKDKISITNLVFDYDLGWATLFASSSWSKQTFSRNYDIGSFFGGLPIPQSNENEAVGFNEEIRVTSQLDGFVQFMVGLYYEDVEETRNQGSFWGGDPTLNIFGADSVLLLGTVEEQLQQSAIFGELSFDVTEKIQVTLGARSFDYERTSSDVFTGLWLNSTTFEESDESDSSYKLNLSYQPNDDTLIYAQWAQGFRLGRPQGPLPAAVCDTDSDGLIDGLNVSISTSDINSDYLDNYELGGKFTFFENTPLVINAAIYDIDWQGIPITVSGTCGFPIVLNAGKASSKGVEFEGALYLAENLDLTFGASYVQAKLSEDADSLGLSGDPLPGSPDYNANLGLDYRFNLGGHSVYIHGDYSYVSGFYNNLQETGIESGGYGLVNMKAGVSIDSFDIEIFAKNLTNENDLAWVDVIFPDTRAYRLRPRTIGMQVGYQF